jgi:hypothetical protein
MLLPIGRIDSVAPKSSEERLTLNIFRVERGSFNVTFNFSQFKPEMCPSTDLLDYMNCKDAKEVARYLNQDLKQCYKTRTR